MAADDSAVTGLAGRYATALFELARDDGVLDRVAADLASLRAMLAGSEDLRRLVRSPILSRDEQWRAMASILAAVGASGLTTRTLGILAQKRRLFALADLIAGYHKLLAAHRGEATAEVVSARELDEAQLAGLKAALERALGREVAIAARVDPALLGGVVVKVGSRMIDNSLRNKLARLQLAMKGVG